MDNYIISRGRVNILKIATRQILNFIEEYKNKGYLDVVREKVKANEEITKLQKEIEHQKEKRENQKAELTILNEKQKEMNKLTNTVSSYKGMFKKEQKDNKKKDKIIDLMAEFIKNSVSEKKLINEICIKGKCNNEECHEDDWKECIKQYFENEV